MSFKYTRFSFFAVAHNDRGYGHLAVCGSITVAQRQGECGSKTAGMHVSQPMNIGVCYAVGFSNLHL